MVRPDEIRVIDLGSRVAGALTPGHKRTIRTKTDGNEDALALMSFGDQGELYLIADSHFGAFSSNTAVDLFLPVVQSYHGSHEARLFFTHLEIDRQLGAKKRDQGQVAEGCSTTLLSVWSVNDQLIWASSGDSSIFLLRDGKLQQVNRGHHALYLGDPINAPRQANFELDGYVPPDVLRDTERFDQALLGLVQICSSVSHGRHANHIADMLKVLEQKLGFELLVEPKDIVTPWSPLNICLAQWVPEFGRFTMKKGDQVLLASDGLEASVSGLSIKDLQEFMLSANGSAAARVSELMLRVLGREGGMDNCALVLRLEESEL